MEYGRALTEKADRAMRRYSLVQAHDTVIVAVSGGADSVALLDYLARRDDLKLSLVVAHLNHSLRGSESDGDEAFVRELASAHGLPFECRRVDVRRLAADGSLSLEDAGRNARYSFFDEVAESHNASSVALAHHGDDQAETVLMRLLRGAGTCGLSGMAFRSRAGRIIRPFLGLRRSDIDGYIASRGLSYRTDSSNADTSFLRNRVRSHLMPLLAGYNPSIARRLSDTAAIAALDEEILDRVVELRWEELARKVAEGVVLPCLLLQGELGGLRLRLYRRALEQVYGTLHRIAFSHLEAIDRLVMEGPSSGRLDLPNQLQVKRCYDDLQFQQGAPERSPVGYELLIDGEGIYDIPGGGRILVATGGYSHRHYSEQTSMAVDLDAYPFPWTVRTFRPGDRIIPSGMSGHKKVKNLFIDAKVPRELRRRIPLFFSGEYLFCVGTLRQAAGAVPAGEDSHVVEIKLLEFPFHPVILP